jgi:hypothetical protein
MGWWCGVGIVSDPQFDVTLWDKFKSIANKLAKVFDKQLGEVSCCVCSHAHVIDVELTRTSLVLYCTVR